MDPNDQKPTPATPAYGVPLHHEKVIQPLAADLTQSTATPAVDLIRQKLDRLFANEPDAAQEEQEAVAEPTRSKHQQFMFDLSKSGKSLAQIQTEWHSYYVGLPEQEKHEVWQEFYAANAHLKSFATHSNSLPTTTQAPQVQTPTNDDHISVIKPLEDKKQPDTTGQTTATVTTVENEKPKTVADMRAQIVAKVGSRTKLSRKQHFQSIAFGLSTGLIVMVIMLFGLFNERFIAPFMTPSRSVTSNAIILDPNNPTVGPNPEIIIPKINVQIPVVYDVQTIDEPAVEVGLQRGVVHYATTPLPGQLGNGVIFGHSANNILNKGDYKFAFVLLHKLEIGDTFYINYSGTQYAYKVFDRKIVPPTDVSVLNTTSQPATFTLITCDPPGTSLNRLIIVGQQVSPNPDKDSQSTVNQNAANKPTSLPSNSPTVWSRFWKWVSN